MADIVIMDDPWPEESRCCLIRWWRKRIKNKKNREFFGKLIEAHEKGELKIELNHKIPTKES